MEHLLDQQAWDNKMSSKLLTDFERTQYAQLKRDLPEKPINNYFLRDICNYYFPSECDLDKDRKNEIRNVFIATVLRYLIARNYTEVDWQQKLEILENQYNGEELFQNLGETEGVWFRQFHYAMVTLKSVLVPDKNKIAYMMICAHLQSSDVTRVYVTGGNNPPETERRVRLFELVTGKVTKKRPRKQTTGQDDSAKPKRGRPRKCSSGDLSETSEQDLLTVDDLHLRPGKRSRSSTSTSSSSNLAELSADESFFSSSGSNGYNSCSTDSEDFDAYDSPKQQYLPPPHLNRQSGSLDSILYNTDLWQELACLDSVDVLGFTD